jgi:predicted Ser/Thr protein kinase
MVLDGIREAELLAWIETQLRHGEAPIHGRGYQGRVYLYEQNRKRFVIKAAAGRGPLRWLRIWMLRREYRVYGRLAGFPGSPRCYGLLAGRYLVLEHIDGEPVRHAPIRDREAFFATLLDYIHELHRRGVAHADLKRKENLLVVDGTRPCLIDFGAAVVRKPGLRPLNRFLFDLARQFDYNAWVKLKHRYIEQAPPQDLAYFRLTRIEQLARWLKRRYLSIKKFFSKPRRERGS